MTFLNDQPRKSNDTSVLICWMCSGRVAIPLDSVLETMRPLPVHPLNGMPPGVLGLAVVRGLASPVLQLEESDEPWSSHTRFVSLRVGQRCVVLVVDRVEGVRSLRGESLQELPALFSGAGSSIASIGTLDRELFIVLSAATLVPDCFWSSLPV